MKPKSYTTAKLIKDKVISIKNTEKNGNFSEVAHVCWERREYVYKDLPPQLFFLHSEKA